MLEQDWGAVVEFAAVLVVEFVLAVFAVAVVADDEGEAGFEVAVVVVEVAVVVVVVVEVAVG